MRKEKQLLLDELKGKIESSPGFVITQYNQLKAPDTTDLRDSVRKSGGDCEVVKKRVFLKAAISADLQVDPEMLDGHVAIMFTGEDSIATTKSTFEFSKKFKDNFKISGGYIDGKLLGATEMETLSKLPGKNEMRAELIGLFQAPLSKFLSIQQAVVTGVIHCLKNKAEAGEGSN